MNQIGLRSWNVLSWNVRGINAPWKWNAIRNKVVESKCDIICFQETKKEGFDSRFLKNVCPNEFDAFDLLPSIGASGGILIAWKSSLFSGERLMINEFGITTQFTSLHDNKSWILTCVYGPCTTEGKHAFTTWMKSIHMPPDSAWIITGDFNL